MASRRIIATRHVLIASAIAAVAIIVLLAMGRPPICTCGTIELWHGAVDAGNSQHIADWYTPSHVIHGFLFYSLGWLLLRRQPAGIRLILAVLIESAWEVAENTPLVIDRYREATIALGYSGDSVLNSAADIGWMTLGFLFAWRAPAAVTVIAALAFELLALWVIRDNLTLNVLMLLSPLEAIRTWQAG